jgi:hypothetical protein
MWKEAVHPEVKYVRYWEARHAAPSFSKKKKESNIKNSLNNSPQTNWFIKMIVLVVTSYKYKPLGRCM